TSVVPLLVKLCTLLLKRRGKEEGSRQQSGEASRFPLDPIRVQHDSEDVALVDVLQMAPTTL
ncbi:hypothetical protein chiPu_0024981, partial [Chiloscyllium punctatum]|nr:hypothetical protein [Chiloscyllium punctatum]